MSFNIIKFMFVLVVIVLIGLMKPIGIEAKGAGGKGGGGIHSGHVVSIGDNIYQN